MPCSRRGPTGLLEGEAQEGVAGVRLWEGSAQTVCVTPSSVAAAEKQLSPQPCYIPVCTTALWVTLTRQNAWPCGIDCTDCKGHFHSLAGGAAFNLVRRQQAFSCSDSGEEEGTERGELTNYLTWLWLAGACEHSRDTSPAAMGFAVEPCHGQAMQRHQPCSFSLSSKAEASRKSSAG